MEFFYFSIKESFEHVLFLEYFSKSTPSDILYFVPLSMFQVSPPPGFLSIQVVNGQPRFHLDGVIMYLKIFIHTKEPFFNILFGIHFHFVSWGFELSRFTLKTIIIYLHFLLRRGWAIARRDLIFFIYEVTRVFFSSLLS